MPALIPFTSNYSDVSTYEGYQFEFHCGRCGNGVRSRFRHSVTGFGGRLAALGGGLLGGQIGSTVQEVGMLAQWGRSSTRGSTNDQRLMEAVDDVAGEFAQCPGCADWVCCGFCWNQAAGCCANCAPRVSLRHPGRGMPMLAGPGSRPCARCSAPVDGRFCGQCGTPAAPAGCGGCGAPQQGTAFCPHCGTPAG